MGKMLASQVGLVVLLIIASLTEAENMRYKDPKVGVNKRVRDLLSRMTLDEKIGQMVQIERKVATSDVMKNYFIGIKSLIFTRFYFDICISCNVFVSGSNSNS